MPTTSIPSSPRALPHRTTYRGLEVLEVYLLARRDAALRAVRRRSGRRPRSAGVWRALERAAERELERAEEVRAVAERAERARIALAEAEQARREAEEQAQRAAAELAAAERADA